MSPRLSIQFHSWVTQTKFLPLERDRKPLVGTAERINWSWNPDSKAQRETLILGWEVIKLPWQLPPCFCLSIPFLCLYTASHSPSFISAATLILMIQFKKCLYSAYSPSGGVLSAKIKDEHNSPFPQGQEACRLLGRQRYINK